ncbi:MAG: hypothetical protein K0Q65_3344, partial [Clostridia bacterium]|nr:hypothetical protein [Clostridia bacterium]
GILFRDVDSCNRVVIVTGRAGVMGLGL